MIKSIALSALLLGAFILLCPNRVLADTISIQPLTDNVSLSSFTLNVNITGVTDLYDWQFDVDFNPAVLSVTGITEGSFLSGGGSTFFIPGAIDNVGGSITFNADTLLGPPPGVNGSGTLATLDFTAIGNGSSPINLENVILQDSSGNNIEFTTANGAVNVGGTTATPEPSSFFMLGTGLLGLIGAAKRKLLFS